MSEDKSSKTEKATPKKLKDARKKGQVPKSKDVVSTVILFLVFIYFIFFWNGFQKNLEYLILSPRNFYGDDTLLAIAGMSSILLNAVLIKILLPFFAITIIGGIIGNLIQFGFLFSWDPVKPKIKKINPVAGFKRIFSLKQLKTTSISVLKVLAISWVLYFVIKLFLNDAIFALIQCNVDCQKNILEHFVKILVGAILFANVCLSIIDYIIQRSEFMKEQKMAKHEVKREHKDTEGDPETKQYRKQLQHEFINNDISQRIKESRVVFYGSGFAVSLNFDKEVSPLPVITSIGKAKMADKMVHIAQSEKIPLYESTETTLHIVATGKIDETIPEESIPNVILALQSLNLV
jgi:type III secretion protein U